jgi:hypothetical protein
MSRREHPEAERFAQAIQLLASGLGTGSVGGQRAGADVELLGDETQRWFGNGVARPQQTARIAEGTNMIATVLAGIAEFERELAQERIRSGIAAAKARGKRLGRQPGERPKSDRLAPKVLALIGLGRSYRLVGRELGLSKNTVADIVKRSRAATSGD